MEGKGSLSSVGGLRTGMGVFHGEGPAYVGCAHLGNPM